MKRTVITIALVFLLLTSGCIGLLADSDSEDDTSIENQRPTDGTASDTTPNEKSNRPSVSDIEGPNDSEYDSTEYSYAGKEKARVHFIDAGQADSTLIQGPESNILIDTGDWQSDDVVGYLESQNIEAVDLMILTHLDADHIGQADTIIRQFDVGEVWMSGNSRRTDTFGELIDAVLQSDVGYYEPRTGDAFTVGDIRLEVVYPDSTPDTSNVGIVTRAVFGDTEVILTGDVEEQIEEEILDSGQELESDIYQVGHHGSATSSTREFVAEINPEVAVYSAAKDSRYGHPDDEVINRLNDMGIDVYGTPVHGTVIIEATPKEDITVRPGKNEPAITTPPSVVSPVGWILSTQRGTTP